MTQLPESVPLAAEDTSPIPKKIKTLLELVKEIGGISGVSTENGENRAVRNFVEF